MLTFFCADDRARVRLSAVFMALACMAHHPMVVAGGTPPGAWATTASVVEHSLADGLPVLTLNQDDWPQRVARDTGMAKAMQRVEAKWLAHHPSGWRLGAVARSQAGVRATPATLELVKILDGKTLPAADSTFALSAQYAGWRGRGVELGVPWQNTGWDTWQWTADAQWLQLTDLRSTRIGGLASYDAAKNNYDFDVSADRYSRRITGPYLGVADSMGTGLSLSLAVKGHIRPDLMLTVQGHDLVSRLHWNRMAQERMRLNTQVTNVRADGFLDYGPAVTGQQSLGTAMARIGARWDSQLQWQHTPAAALSARWVRVAEMNELWLGWDSKWAGSTLDVHLGYETIRQAVQARLAWKGLYLSLGTDGRGAQSGYRQIALGWHLRLD